MGFSDCGPTLAALARRQKQRIIARFAHSDPLFFLPTWIGLRLITCVRYGKMCYRRKSRQTKDDGAKRSLLGLSGTVTSEASQGATHFDSGTEYATEWGRRSKQASPSSLKTICSERMSVYTRSTPTPARDP